LAVRVPRSSAFGGWGHMQIYKESGRHHTPIYLHLFLSIYLSTYLSIYLPTYLSVRLCPSLCLSVGLSICLSIYMCIDLSIYLSFYLFYLPVYLLSFYLSICLSASLYLSVCLLLAFLNITTIAPGSVSYLVTGRFGCKLRYNQFDEIPSFDTSYKPQLLGTNKTPYL
jgi:hypothetical protein